MRNSLVPLEWLVMQKCTECGKDINPLLVSTVVNEWDADGTENQPCSCLQLEFKTAWVAAFTATWAAINYAEACADGQHERLENPPLSDAEYLAMVHWQKWKNLNAI
jgi:hypothetical protein